MKPNEKVLITGANGFIGKFLSEALIEWGLKVVGLPRELLSSPSDLEGYFEEIAPDYIIHLATYGNMYDQDDEDEMLSTNVIKLWLLLKATKDINYKAFINISTSSVYGKKVDSMKETMLPEGNTLYALTKLCGENLCKHYAKNHNKPIVTIRPFSVTGVGEQEKHLIPTLIKSAFTQELIPLVTEPTHDYIWVGDLVTAIAILASKADSLRGQVFNCGYGVHYSNGAVRRIVDEVSGRKVNSSYTKDMRSYDSDYWVADNTKLRSMGWSPVMDLKQVISDMVDDYVERNKKP